MPALNIQCMFRVLSPTARVAVVGGLSLVDDFTASESINTRALSYSATVDRRQRGRIKSDPQETRATRC